KMRVMRARIGIVRHAQIGAPGDDVAANRLVAYQRQEHGIVNDATLFPSFRDALPLLPMTDRTSSGKDETSLLLCAAQAAAVRRHPLGRLFGDAPARRNPARVCQDFDPPPVFPRR